MARTAVTPRALARGASVLQDAGVSLDPTNGHVIAGPSVSGQAVLLDIDSTFGGAKTFTIKAGAWPGSQDKVVSLNATRATIMLTSDYAQADGSFLVDVAAGATGTIRAATIPHH